MILSKSNGLTDRRQGRGLLGVLLLLIVVIVQSTTSGQDLPQQATARELQPSAPAPSPTRKMEPPRDHPRSLWSYSPRFQVLGPVIIITLKEPTTTQASSFPSSRIDNHGHDLALAAQQPPRQQRQSKKQPRSPTSSPSFLFPLKSLASSVYPKATWSIQTSAPLLGRPALEEDETTTTTTNKWWRPGWVPILHQIRANITYDYKQCRSAPSAMETTCHFQTRLGDVWLQPSWNLTSRQSDMSLSFLRGTSFVKARFFGSSIPATSNHVAGNNNQPRQRSQQQQSQQQQSCRRGQRFFGIRTLLGSFFFNLPYSAIQSIRINPLLDFSASYPDFQCQLEATTTTGLGGILSSANGGRRLPTATQAALSTKAILHLEYNNPTLTIIHPLNEWNTVSPKISIYTAKITYQWDVKFNDSGTSTLCTKIDPLDAITMTWTDPCQLGGGSWIADLRVPLVVTAPASSYSSSSSRQSETATGRLRRQGQTALASAWAADIRIRRQFKF